ncbi:MAG: flagella basal body P-ring formation protein FlgA [Candidatus Korobacteraceae bacterium]
MKNWLVRLWIASLLAGVHTFAAVPPQSVLLSSQDIAAALSQNDFRVSQSQVELLTEVRSTRAEPPLEVMSVGPWRTGSMKVRLRCRQHEVCLPFYVLVNWPSAVESETAISRWNSSGSHAIAPSVPQHGRWLVHNGEPVTLVIEREHLRVQLPVVCLENGSAGNTIRARSTDHKRIYVAEVVGEKLLKGQL